MFHCHNLIHEDHDMMAAFNVTKLANFGYNETTDFSDPMDPRFRAKPYTRANVINRTGPFSDAAITATVQNLANLQPYSELTKVEQALTDYWTKNGAGNPNSPVRRDLSDASPLPGPVPRYRRFQI
jgi:bilirubin oxidase